MLEPGPGADVLHECAAGEFATEARLALHRSGWTDSLEKLRELIESGA